MWEVRWTWWLLVAVFRRRAAAPYVYRGNQRTAFNHMRVYIMLLSDNMGIQYQLELVDLHTIQRIGSMWRPNNSTNVRLTNFFFCFSINREGGQTTFKLSWTNQSNYDIKCNIQYALRTVFSIILLFLCGNRKIVSHETWQMRDKKKVVIRKLTLAVPLAPPRPLPRPRLDSARNNEPSAP